MLTRRSLIGAGGGVLAAGLVRADTSVIEIRMRSDEDGAHIGFDPVGLLIQPGQTLRWVCEANYHTATAYHPDNGGHSLRIPRTVPPWSSDVLQPGEHFDLTLNVPGVYDYFCAPHEQAGMVGRIIVGTPTGPGGMPFDWFKGRQDAKDWLPVPDAARKAFPAVADIMRRRTIPGTALAMAHSAAAVARGGAFSSSVSRCGASTTTSAGAPHAAITHSPAA